MKKQLLNEPDIFELLTKMQEQLTALDRKMDVVISKSAAQTIAARPNIQPSFVPPKPMNAQVQTNARPNDQRQGRPMHRATCADCQKECELPFKPTGDRPVYCKECFAKRRAGGNALKVTAAPKPQAEPVVQAVVPVAVNVAQPPVKKKQKSPAAKKSSAKPAAKKKTVAKKKR